MSAELTPGWVPFLRTSLQMLNVGGDTGQVVADTAGYHLLPYQREAVSFALDRGGRAMFCHEMGLGKTPIVRFIYVLFLSVKEPTSQS